MMRSTRAKLGAAVAAGSAVFTSSATALTSSFTVAIEFFDPFVVAETSVADFGRIVSGVAATYYMDSAGNITPGSGGASTGGTPGAGGYTITDSGGASIVDVTVDNPVANGGVSITGFDCDWNGGASTDAGATCLFNGVPNPGAGGDVLLLGFNISVDGTQTTLATASPTFDVTVSYD